MRSFRVIIQNLPVFWGVGLMLGAMLGASKIVLLLCVSNGCFFNLEGYLFQVQGLRTFLAGASVQMQKVQKSRASET